MGSVKKHIKVSHVSLGFCIKWPDMLQFLAYLENKKIEKNNNNSVFWNEPSRLKSTLHKLDLIHMINGIKDLGKSKWNGSSR